MVTITKYGNCNIRRVVYTFNLSGQLEHFEFQELVNGAWQMRHTWNRSTDSTSTCPYIPDIVVAAFDSELESRLGAVEAERLYMDWARNYGSY